MKFKKDVEPIYSDDHYYDLFDGGYITPEELLEAEDAEKVREAMSTIEEFLGKAERDGIIISC